MTMAGMVNRRHRPYGRKKLVRFVKLYALKLLSSVLTESAANVMLASTALIRSSVMVRLYGSIVCPFVQNSAELLPNEENTRGLYGPDHS